MTVKSTLTKRTIRGEKVVEKKNQQQHQKRQNWRVRERERERERIDLFVVNNLEGIGERGGNEVKEIYKKIKLEEEE